MASTTDKILKEPEPVLSSEVTEEGSIEMTIKKPEPITGPFRVIWVTYDCCCTIVHLEDGKKLIDVLKEHDEDFQEINGSINLREEKCSVEDKTGDRGVIETICVG